MRLCDPDSLKNLWVLYYQDKHGVVERDGGPETDYGHVIASLVTEDAQR